MSQEYNSILISQLYTVSNERRLTDVVGEIEEIGDPVFLQPLLDAYKKHKNSTIGHYFLSGIGAISSKDAAKTIDQLFTGELGIAIREDHKTWLIRIANEQKYTSNIVSEFAVSYIRDYIENIVPEKQDYMDSLDLEEVLSYLENASLIESIAHHLKNLLFASVLSKNEKAVILQRFLKIPSVKPFNYLLETFTPGKSVDDDILLAKELLGWRGTVVEQLKNKIIEFGHSRAKEILIKDREKKAIEARTQEEKNEQSQSVIFGNISIVNEIRNFRKKINTNTLLNPNFQFLLITDSESLMEQSESAQTESQLIQHAINLRTIFQGFNVGLENHGLDPEEVRKLLPSVELQDLKKPINQLFLFLSAKKYDSAEIVNGLRSLNRALSLLAHPEEKKELLDKLKELGLLEFYEKSDWKKLHLGILTEYKKFLSKLYELISQTHN